MPGNLRNVLIVFLCAGGVLLSACAGMPFGYKPEVQQGNIITDDMIAELRPGMSKRQARFVLGSPAIEDMFRTNRWDYVHSTSPGGGGPTDRLTLIFDDAGQLVELQGNLAPEDWREDS